MTSPPPPVRLPEADRFSDILSRLGREGGPELSVGEGMAAFGERGVAAMMLLFALINMLPLPPGGTTITGFPLLFLSVELAIGRQTHWLPRRLREARVKRETFRKGFGWLVPIVRFAENLTRPRLLWLTGWFGQGLIGLTCFLLSIVLVLPIPLGNIAPAVTIGLFSLGMMQRDGIVVVLGWVSTAISVGLLAFAWKVVWGAIRHVVEQVTTWGLPIP